jgi:hypothetical protein
MALSEEEARVYRQTLETARRQLDEINTAIERELAQVRERLDALQNKRKAALQMYDAACTMLGIDNDLAREEIEEMATETETER